MTSVKTGVEVNKQGNDIIGTILGNPQVQEQLVGGLLNFILGLFRKKPKPVPSPGDVPVPNPNNTGDFDDDVIPPPVPVAKRKIKEVRIVTSRLQWARSLNPEKYTEENKQGLYPNPRSYEGGTNAVNIGSKGWFDLTAFDEQGNEFKPEAVALYGLAYKTEHHVGDAFIKGNGGSIGNPNPGYETQDGQVGNGITAWKSSNGFLHQVKFHGEGTWEVWGSVDGVVSNKFIIRVD